MSEISTIYQEEMTQADKMETYYSFQSRIYDATRWSFLFGRNGIIRMIPELDEASHILEVGCGTGYNLQKLQQRFPKAYITGLDIAQPMLDKAAKKIKHPNIKLVNQAYGDSQDEPYQKPVDVILFSYSLSMINPNWSELIDQAMKDLKPGGYIAVVDFEDSEFSFFKQHMSGHHVKMDSHLLPYLTKKFETVNVESKEAYLGLWSYLMFVGRKC